MQKVRFNSDGHILWASIDFVLKGRFLLVELAHVMKNSDKIVKRAFLLAVNSIIHASPELILMRREGFRLN